MTDAFHIPVQPLPAIEIVRRLEAGGSIDDYLATRNEVLPHSPSDRGITNVVDLVRMVARHKMPADTKAGSNKSFERTREG